MAEKRPVSAKYDDKVFSPFILRDEHLTKLNTIVRDYLGTNPRLRWYLECKHNLTLEYDAVADVRKYENHKSRKIICLWIYGTSEDRERTISIFLRSFRHSTANIKLEGPGATVMTLQAKLSDFLESMKPWYTEIAKPRFYYGFPLALSFVPFLYLIITRGVHLEDLNQHPEVTWRSVAALAINAVCVFGVSSIIYSIQDWLFPSGFFAIGQGVEREQRLSKWRSLILVVIGLGLVLGVVSSVIATLAMPLFGG